MPAYATRAAFEAYVEGWTTTDPDALDRLLERATRDVDSVLGPLHPRRTGAFAGLKLDPAELDEVDAEALSRATCAQAEWRFLRGEDAVAGSERAAQRIEGPDFSITYSDAAAGGGPPQRIAPKVRAELGPLLRFRPTGARARA